MFAELQKDRLSLGIEGLVGFKLAVKKGLNILAVSILSGLRHKSRDLFQNAQYFEWMLVLICPATPVPEACS